MDNDTLDSLRHLIQCHPLIDNHAHNILDKASACNYAKYPFEQITSEAQGVALQNATSTLPLHRAASQLAVLYDCPSSDWEQVKAARQKWVERDYDGLVRQCLQGTHTLLLDDLLADQDIEPYQWHDQFTVSATKRIVRIEALAARMLATVMRGSSILEAGDVSALESRFLAFRDGFSRLVSEAIEDPAVVGFKSVICYRTGLNVQPTDEDAGVLLQSFARTIRTSEAGYRVEDKPLNDWLVRQTLDLLQASKSSSKDCKNKPLQLHTGLGDNDISLVLANPAYLQPLIARYPQVDFVLLHSSYPYTREAGYLACVYPNVYLDLGEVFPMVSRDAEESIIRDSLDIVPTNRLLWSTDGHFFPETFYLGNKQFRDVLEKVFVDYVRQGDWTVTQAKEAAADILFHNANRLYDLNEQPSFDQISKPITISSTHTLETFMRCNPDVKYVWMQWVDYTATTRLRIFPILEFAKIVRKQRRIGISLCVFWMLQDDSMTPEGTTTGQFYMEPDLTSLSPNVGLGSKSATVMTFWRSEENKPLEGCPRTALQNIVDKLHTDHGIAVTCGFEIEVIFLRPDTDPSTGETRYLPAVTNHSWSQMTSDTRRMLPLLEEIADTLTAIGIPLEQFHSESAPGQFEFVLPRNSPLPAVDTLLKARQVVANVAERHGLRATLHPRPLPNFAGTASHAHVSISPSTNEDSFLAGVLAHFPALLACTLAQETSYDRVKSGLWAGSEWVAWGTQNREAPVRKIEPGHWELKSLDGLANMYVAMAAFLGAGYLGLEHKIPLTVKDCLYDAATLTDAQREDLGITTRLPNTLAQSLDALESDHALQELLGPFLVRSYVIVKRAESKKLAAMGDEERRKWLIERY
ncbi:hypothetical protein V6000_004169 [Aspergillus fumigatus]